MKRRNTFRAALALLLILTLCMPAAASGFTGKLIAITFDDGPGAYTAQLLDELARDLKYGTLTLVFQDGLLVQVDRNEKFRLPKEAADPTAQ